MNQYIYEWVVYIPAGGSAATTEAVGVADWGGCGTDDGCWFSEVPELDWTMACGAGDGTEEEEEDEGMAEAVAISVCCCTGCCWCGIFTTGMLSLPSETSCCAAIVLWRNSAALICSIWNCCLSWRSCCLWCSN